MRGSKVTFPTPSLVKIDGKENQEFPTIGAGEMYFDMKKKQLKGTGTLMALYKKVNGKWTGIKHN